MDSLDNFADEYNYIHDDNTIYTNPGNAHKIVGDVDSANEPNTNVINEEPEAVDESSITPQTFDNSYYEGEIMVDYDTAGQDNSILINENEPTIFDESFDVEGITVTPSYESENTQNDNAIGHDIFGTSEEPKLMNGSPSAPEVVSIDSANVPEHTTNSDVINGEIINELPSNPRISANPDYEHDTNLDVITQEKNIICGQREIFDKIPSRQRRLSIQRLEYEHTATQTKATIILLRFLNNPAIMVRFYDFINEVLLNRSDIAVTISQLIESTEFGKFVQDAANGNTAGGDVFSTLEELDSEFTRYSMEKGSFIPYTNALIELSKEITLFVNENISLFQAKSDIRSIETVIKQISSNFLNAFISRNELYLPILYRAFTPHDSLLQPNNVIQTYYDVLNRLFVYGNEGDRIVDTVMETYKGLIAEHYAIVDAILSLRLSDEYIYEVDGVNHIQKNGSTADLNILFYELVERMKASLLTQVLRN